jgi:hypothetical protein
VAPTLPPVAGAPPPLSDEPAPHGDPLVDEHEAATAVHPTPTFAPAPAADPGPPTAEFDVETVEGFDDADDFEDDDEEPGEGEIGVFDEVEEEGGDFGDEDDEYAEEDEDVLEETPEFLSETPEHDRLWFEQKPPRDFDFDK